MKTSTKPSLSPRTPVAPRQSAPHPAELFDEELERAVISAMVQSGFTLHDAIPHLDPECFLNPMHREVFEAMRDMHARGENVDIVILHQTLARKGSAIRAFQLAELTSDCHDFGLMSQHLSYLKELALRRRLWMLAQSLGAGSMDRTQNVEQVQHMAREALDSLFSGESETTRTFRDVFEELRGEILQRMTDPQAGLRGTPTGFRELDERGGLEAADLIVVAAETSQGKTSFATSLALSAIEHGHGVAFYSMEMTLPQLAARITSMKSGVQVGRIIDGRIDVAEYDRIVETMSGYPGDLLYFDEDSSISLASMAMSIRTLRLRHGIRGVVVDYLQLVDLRDPKANREQAMGQCARVLKNLAKELGIWIIAISQLSRNGQVGTLPTKSRLRDSGQIEEAADIVILLHRPAAGVAYPEPFAEVSTDGTAMVMVEKGRNIGTFRFICGFDARYTRFHPLSPGELPVRADPIAAALQTPGADATPFADPLFDRFL